MVRNQAMADAFERLGENVCQAGTVNSTVENPASRLDYVRCTTAFNQTILCDTEMTSN